MNINENGLDGDRCMGDTPTSSSFYLPMACCLSEVQETLNLFFKKKLEDMSPFCGATDVLDFW